STTMPAPSTPRTNGKRSLPVAQVPSRLRASQMPTPAAWRAIRISLGPTFGTGRLRSVNPDGGPKRPIASACMVVGAAEVVDTAATLEQPLPKEGARVHQRMTDLRLGQMENPGDLSSREVLHVPEHQRPPP